MALAFAFALAAGLSTSALAQPGDGVRVGGWILHPSVEGDAAYQTNVHLLARPGLSRAPDDFFLRIVPQLSAERQGTRVRLKLLALYDWRQYLFNTKLDAHDNFGLGFTSAFDEERDLSIVVDDQFRVQQRPDELELLGQYHRDSNVAKIGTVYRPGEALEVRPTAFWDYDHFTDTDHFSNTRMSFAERHTGGVSVDARWAFLSRTVFVLGGQGGRVHYSQSVALPAVPGQSINSGSTFWHVEAGVVGAMSAKINVSMKAGFGQQLYERNESLSDARGLTAQVKAEWSPRDNIRAVAGYDRNFEDVFFTNFDVVDRLYANYKHTLRGQFIVQGDAIGEWQQYSRPYERRDFVLRLTPRASRLINTWADVGASYQFERRWSHLQQISGPASADPPSAYVTHLFMVTANLKW